MRGQTLDNIAQIVLDLEGELIALRRDFHHNPELGLAEFRTSKIIRSYLENLGLQCHTCNSTGVVTLLQGDSAGPTILLRADIDALPIHEDSQAPYRSRTPGIMHACGHDAHAAMLMVAAKILSRTQDKLHGNVKLVFEPNEENAGSLAMIREGVLKDPDVSSCLGVHVWSPLESGTVGVKSGPIMAGMKHFSLKIHGVGGHTATPHSGKDPILPACSIVQSVQAIQTRETDALHEPLVIMFGSISGGSADNVIPEDVTLKGTIRYLADSGEDDPGSPLVRFRRVIEGICRAHDTEFELEFTHGHPSLVNDPAMVNMLTRDVIENNRMPLCIEPFTTLAGDDFSEFSSRVPGVYYFLGAGKPGEKNYPHHHPRFTIDESVLKYGVEIHVRSALQFLRPRTSRT